MISARRTCTLARRTPRALRHAGTVIFSAFGRDVVGAVLRTGPAPFGHHHGPLTAVVTGRLGGRRWQALSGRAESRKQQRAAGRRHIGAPVRKEPDHGAVGQLLVAPATESLQQVMLSTESLQV